MKQETRCRLEFFGIVFFYRALEEKRQNMQAQRPRVWLRIKKTGKLKPLTWLDKLFPLSNSKAVQDLHKPLSITFNCFCGLSWSYFILEGFFLLLFWIHVVNFKLFYFFFFLTLSLEAFTNKLNFVSALQHIHTRMKMMIFGELTISLWHHNLKCIKTDISRICLSVLHVFFFVWNSNKCIF